MKQYNRPRPPAAMCLCVMILLLATGPTARAGFGAGVHGGVSRSPGQVILGGQAMLGSVAPLVELVPSIDFGYGDKLSVTAINVDFRLNLPSLPKVSPNLYVGAGPTLALIKPDAGERMTEFGFSALAGLKIPMGPVAHYKLEARYGIGDIPEIKILIGIIWGL